MSIEEFFAITEVGVDNMNMFGLNYILWIVIPLILLVPLFFIFRKYQNFGKKALLVIAIYLLAVRLIKNIVFKAWLWDEGWHNVVPFQLCGVLIYILPFTIFFNTKKLNAFLYPLAILGGFVMILYPDWVFNGGNMSFNKLESLFAHIFLFYIPILQLAVGNFKFNIKDIWKPLVALAALAGYAHIGNLLIPNRNFMFLVENPLPFDLPIPHLIVLGTVSVLFIALLYLPSVIRQLVAKRKNKQLAN